MYIFVQETRANNIKAFMEMYDIRIYPMTCGHGHKNYNDILHVILIFFLNHAHVFSKTCTKL